MRFRVRAVAPIAAILVAAVFVSCRQVVGVQDDPPNEPVTTACGLPYGTNACASCANTRCCDQSMQCAGDSSCKQFASCFGGCGGDPGCWDRCLISFQTTVPSATALNVCMATNCESDCALTCGAFAATPYPPDAAAACQTCIVSKQCKETRACARSADCDALNRCLAACRTQDCRQSCRRAHGQVIDFAPTADAGEGNPNAPSSCSTDCQSGALWTCVGHVERPPTAATSITWHFWLKDFLMQQNPVNGANVEVCGQSDISDGGCAAPLVTGTTSGEGEVLLPFKTETVGAGGAGDGFFGYLAISGTDIRPYFYQWNFPLTQSDFFSYGLSTSPPTLPSLAAAVNDPLDPTKGALSVAVYDCIGATAPGVRITLDPADGKTKSFRTDLTPSDVTDQTGLLLFSNVPVGSVNVTATPLSLGRSSSTATTFIRAGATTSLQMLPSQ